MVRVPQEVDVPAAMVLLALVPVRSDLGRVIQGQFWPFQSSVILRVFFDPYDSFHSEFR